MQLDACGGAADHVSSTVMHQSIWSFNIPPPPSPLGKPQAFDHCPCLGGGKFEPCAAGVGDFNQKRQVFSMKYRCYILK